MAKVHLDRIAKKFGTEGWEGKNYRSLMKIIIAENTQLIGETLLEEDVVNAMYCEDNFKRLDRAWELAGEKGVSLPQIALAFVLAQPMKTHPFTGGADGDQIAQNVSCLEIDLTPAELAWLDLQSETR